MPRTANDQGGLTNKDAARVAVHLGLCVRSVENWTRAKRGGGGRGGCSAETERRIIQAIIELGLFE